MPKKGQLKGTPARRAKFVEQLRLLGEGDDHIQWPWSDITGKYVRVYIDGRKTFAHRWVYEQFNGPLAERHQPGATGDDLVLHRCDVRHCVRPSHLYAGDAARNTRDASERGRLSARLSMDDVIAIRRLRAAGATMTMLAKAYGVSTAHVSNIIHRKKRTIGFDEPTI